MAFMVSPPSDGLASDQRAALDAMVVDLRAIFGSRLLSLVAYGFTRGHTDRELLRTLGLVEQLTFEDLSRAAPLSSTWQRRGLAVPLLLSRHEFDRTLDVFPLEYGNIIADHVVVAGLPPFADTQIDDADRRRGCEQQAKSHLIHLREGFLETQNDPRGIARLISSSADSFHRLLVNIARLEGSDWRTVASDSGMLAAAIEDRLGVPAPLTLEVFSSRTGISTVADPSGLLARYIAASERIWRYVDGWRG
jgi:hypothetical protein